MKIRRLTLALVAVVIAGFGLGASTPTQPAALKEKSKKEELPKIDGMELARPSGGFLGLKVVGGKLMVSFYDAKKKKSAPDVARGTIRWKLAAKSDDERSVLNLGADGALVSARTVPPPYNFNLFLALFVEGKEEAVETHAIIFRQ